MSAVLRKPMTVDEFLVWESQQELKYEFDGFEPVAMTGATLAHAMIQANLIRAVGNRMRGGPCRVVGSDLKVSVAGSIRYPDVFIFCSDLPRGTLVVTEPVVVVEISSPCTAAIDRIDKNREYRDTPSIQRYVMVEQDRVGATIFTRAGGDWVGHLVHGEAMPEIGVEIPLMALYEDVDFSTPSPDTI